MKKEKRIWPAPFLGDEFGEAWTAWLEVREAMRKPILTEPAYRLNINKLLKLAGMDENKATEIVNQSVERQWLSFYEIQNNTNVGTNQTGAKQGVNSAYKQQLFTSLGGNESGRN